jgi:hypothetical protein
MATHNTKGTISTTQLVAPASFVGKYAADGSWNVVVNGGGAPFVGLHHPSGALNVVITADLSLPFNSPNGSMHVFNNSQGGVSPLNPREHA